MATAQDVLRTVVQLDGASQYQSGMRGVASSVELAAQKQQVLMQLQTRQAASFGVLGAGLLGLAGQWTKLAGVMEQSRIGFTTLLRSGSQARQFVKDLQQFAAATPFEFMDLQAQAKRLLAFGFAAKDVIPMLTTLGDTIGALGGGQETMGRVIIALGQMQAKGRVMGQELLQLAEAGVPVYDILQQKLNLTGEEMRRVGERGIEASKAIPALLEGLNERYGGGMAAQFGTLNQQLSNLADNAAIVGAAFGEGLIGPVKAAASVAATLGQGLNQMSTESKASIGLAVGLAGAMITLKGAMLGANAARISYNLLLAQQAAITAQAAAATREQATAVTSEKVASAPVAASASARAIAINAEAAAARAAAAAYLEWAAATRTWTTAAQTGMVPYRGGGRPALPGTAAPSATTTGGIVPWAPGPGAYRRPAPRVAAGETEDVVDWAAWRRARAARIAAQEEAAIAASTRVSLPGMSWGSGSIGVWGKQIAGLAAATSAIDAISRWNTSDTGDKISSLGKTVGYTVGVFVPLIGVATALADVLARLVDAGTSSETPDAKFALGVNPKTNAPFTPQEAYDYYLRQKTTTKVGLGAEEYKLRNREAYRRAEKKKGFLGSSREDVEAEMMGMATDEEKAWAMSAAQSAMRSYQVFNRSPEKTSSQIATDWEFEAKYADATGDPAKQVEALKHAALYRRDAAQTAWNAAAAAEDEADRDKNIATYREEILKALGLENDAKKIGSDLTEKEQQDVKKSSADRLTLAHAYSQYVAAIYGDKSSQAKDALENEHQALLAESELAYSLGDTARAYDLATQAVNLYSKATEDANKQMDQALATGAAYVDYLRAVGREKEAVAFERSQMAAGQSSLAQSLFAQGDVEGGYKAAAAAERFARSGKSGGLFGEVPYANRALTGAAYNAPGVNIQVQTHVDMGDGYRKRQSKQFQGDMEKTMYYDTFTL